MESDNHLVLLPEMFCNVGAAYSRAAAFCTTTLNAKTTKVQHYMQT